MGSACTTPPMVHQWEKDEWGEAVFGSHGLCQVSYIKDKARGPLHSP
jgi:hypothetical protein